jgi:hypothetical protein
MRKTYIILIGVILIILAWYVSSRADQPSTFLNCKEKCREEVVIVYDKNGVASMKKTGDMICEGSVFDNCEEE